MSKNAAADADLEIFKKISSIWLIVENSAVLKSQLIKLSNEARTLSLNALSWGWHDFNVKSGL